MGKAAKLILNLVLCGSVLYLPICGNAETLQISEHGIKSSGTFENNKNTEYIYTVLAANYAIDAMIENEPIENTDKVVFMSTGVTDSDGNYSEEFNIDKNSGTYTVLIHLAKTGELISTETINYINSKDFSDAIKKLNELIKNSKSNDEILEFIKNNNYVLQFDLKRFTCDYLKAVDIFKNNINKTKLDDTDVSGYRTLFLNSAFIESINESAVQNALEYNDCFENIIPEIAKYAQEGKLLAADSERNAYTKNISSLSIFDNEELRAVMAEKLLLFNIENFDGVDNLKNAFTDFYNDFKIDISAHSDMSIIGVSGKVYAKIDDYLTALKNYGDKSSESSSGRGNSGGGSGSGRAIGATETGNQQPNTIEEIPIDVYTDLEGVIWARNAIVSLTNKGILSGRTDSLFEPNEKILREEFVKILSEAFIKTDSDEELNFDDADKNAWYYKFLKKAVKGGIVTGQSEHHFGIGENITREDMAVMLYRAAYSDVDGDIKELEFTDNENISDYAKKAVVVLVSKGIINGMPDGSFAPKANATRAEAAKMVYEVLK